MPPRRTTTPQSALQTPLNEILGTETNVRLLRVLVSVNHPITLAELARRASVHISGVAKALSTLEEAGVVEYIGAGRRRPVAFRAEHPLSEALRALFAVERDRYHAIIDGLKRAALAVSPPPRSVWIEGPFTTGEDRPGEPVVVGVLANARELDQVVSSFIGALGKLERELDVTVEVRGRTIADIIAPTRAERTALLSAVPLLGAPPLTLLDRAEGGEITRAAWTRMASHEDLDARGRERAAAIAERLREDPSLVDHARAFIDERLAVASPGEQRELREWKRVLRTMSLPRLRRFLVDEGERATRLRQTMPFLGVDRHDQESASALTRQSKTRTAQDATRTHRPGRTRKPRGTSKT